jgi:hypothetical protein
MSGAHHQHASAFLNEAEHIKRIREEHEAAEANKHKDRGTVVQHPTGTTGGYDAHPRNNSNATVLPTKVLSHNDDHMPTNHITPQPLNMHLQNTIASQRMMVKECVKTTLFRRLKFFKKDVHGLFDVRSGSVCAMIIENCNVSADEADQVWWADMRKLVVATHTDRRNNVIKNMRLRFYGTCTLQALQQYFKKT